VVRAGDTLSEIATRFRVNVRELMSYNNIRSARSLQVGQRLVVPGTTGEQPANVRLASAPAGAKTYTVRRGDSLSAIARRHGVNVRDLQDWNNLGRSTRIHVGDTVRVDVSGQSGSSTPSGAMITHVVRRGEFPASIAKRYGADLDDFLRWNNLTKSSMIRVGDKLKVYTGKSASAPVGGRKVVHRVARGESASIIAAKYDVSTNDFLSWNDLSPASVLRVGDEFVVYAGGGNPQDSEITLAKSVDNTSTSRRVEHVVTRGQNPTTIARRYGVRVSDLFTWNGWQKTPVLQVGDKVVIYAQ